jgi:PAS domain S-box-containing protein
MLSRRASGLADLAAVTRLRVDLYTTLDRSDRAVEVCLEYLRRIGVPWPPHPSKDDVTQEYEKILRQLGSRSIEELVDLPPMTDPDCRATVDVLTSVLAPAMFTDETLRNLVVCRMTNLSLEHGNSDGSCLAYVWLGMILGPHFGDYRAGFRFGKLGFDLVEKGGRDGFKARVYMSFGRLVIPWTRHVSTGLPLVRRAFDTANRMGDLTYAAFSCNSLITNLLATGDPLDDVQREAEHGLEFARKARFGFVVDCITGQLRLIRALRGLTPNFSSFNEAEFNECSFEQHLEEHPTLALPMCWYWIRKLQARVYAGDYVSAIEAASKAQDVLWTSPSRFEVAEYHFYSALARAAHYEAASAYERAQHLEALGAHHKQLDVWAENCPENFANRAALIAAEVARIEGRAIDAMHSYEQAIQSAREHGFVQNEALAHEVAARFYLAHGFETIAHAYLRNARNCYDRWGALGKLKQLDALYPHLHEERGPTPLTATFGAFVEQLDVGTVVKASQALSSEIVLPKLIETLMRIVVEHAGAERGLLILLRGDDPQIEAEATTGHGRIQVTVRQTAVSPSDLPQSALHFVIRTRERVVLDDASDGTLYSADEYVRQKRSRSLLCLPIVKQTKLVGVLYLENNLTPRAFTSDRVAVLELLASQAAISLENARLYSDLQHNEQRLRDVIDTIPTMAWSALPDGSVDFVSQSWLDYTGFSMQDWLGSGWRTVAHPEDLERTAAKWQKALATGEPYECEVRTRTANGLYRWCLSRAVPLRDDLGKIVKWFGTNTDIDERRKAEENLQRSETFLAEAQSISHTGSFGWSVLSGEIYWSEETYNIFEHDRVAKPTLEWVLQRIHPSDRDLVQKTLDRATNERTNFDVEHRLLMPDGSVKHVHVRALKTSSGNLEFVGAVTDVTAAKQAEETLQESEAYLAEAQRLSHTGSWAWTPATGEIRYWSEECYRLLGFDPHGGQPSFETFFQRIHPNDQAKTKKKLETARGEKGEFELDYRIVHPGGEIRDIHVVGHPVLNPSGDLVDFVGTVIDVTERNRAERKIRQSEKELRQLLDLTPFHITEFGPDGSPLYNNQAALNYHGLTLEEWKSADLDTLLHPQDAERLRREHPGKFLSGSPYEIEARLRRKDGHYRWFLFRFNPILDEQGCLKRWYAAATDIEDRKQAEQRLQNENVALREEIDKASMFEEIVGTSPPLQTVLSRISKVAPTDSSVLITGETGTGKELVARAIHKRSRRSSRAFVSVNCAIIPRDLIASELFGHEKGAFTGATQRRLGRFELAEGGTIFLDEIGELPAETQIALLRVLQEHEFDRVGGSGSVRTNVRVIAATNRDLEAAIAAGLFRSDLFYRFNVFPIEMPPLRERTEDIPLLVGYFIDRYARKAGKNFQAVNKKSLDLLQSYPWPGNIRELQNVIERSVIVCETENFSVDESWLSRRPLATEPNRELGLSKRLPSQEKAIIEAALRETGGRVSGPLGAAAKLGIHRSTLDSKIRSLKINAHRFKTVALPKNS